MTKKLHIRTYGCQMNVYDSARMADVLTPLGFEMSDRADDADLVILNTCHIREKAAEKVYSELGRLRALKETKARAGGRMMLAVAGCVAQAQGAELVRRAPQVDIVVGPQSYHRLPRMVTEASRRVGAVIDLDFPPEPKFDHLPETATVTAGAAFLTVQEGCDKFCTFCVVPYTRGAEYSRPVAGVLAEAGRLASAGACEITLLGQNVNAYHGRAPDGSGWRLAHLIAAVADIPGVERIRYTTSYPAEVDDDLIAAHRDVPQLMPFLHLPVQSGSDRVLKAMNRRHGAHAYLRLADRLRAARPDLALATDLIVGFPGETEADFQATLALVEEVGFVQAYAFKFSPRPGTPAASLDGQVPEAEKDDRLARLLELVDRQQRTFNRASVGRVMAVLMDRRGRRPGQLVGRSPYMQPVHAALGDDRLGTIVAVRITAGHDNSLAGEPIDAPATSGASAGNAWASLADARASA